MKKLLLIVLLIIAASCTGGVNYRVKVQKGDVRKTYTQEYVITEVCDGCNGFGCPQWTKTTVEKLQNEETHKEE